MSAETPERLAIRNILNLLKPFLASYVATEAGMKEQAARQDATGLMQTIITRWEELFSRKLPRVIRSYIFELRDIRNRWAHEETFTSTDVKRAADTAALVGEAIGMPVSKIDEIRAVAGAGARVPRVSSRLRSARSPSQREVMVSIYERVGNDHDRVVQEYAAAERRGEVVRRSNKGGTDAESYARALLADGLKKGWLG